MIDAISIIFREHLLILGLKRLSSFILFLEICQLTYMECSILCPLSFFEVVFESGKFGLS